MLRNTIEKKPQLVLGSLGVLVLLAVVYAVYRLNSDGGLQATHAPESYFTVDDGKTTFTAPASTIPPFDHEGKQAVLAVLFACPGQKPEVVYLERRTETAKAKLEALRGKSGPPDPMMMKDLSLNGREVKKPGAGDWVRASDFQKAGQITGPAKCPDGAMPAQSMPE